MIKGQGNEGNLEFHLLGRPSVTQAAWEVPLILTGAPSVCSHSFLTFTGRLVRLTY